MPQHLWEGSQRFRICEVCLTCQTRTGDRWAPECSSICPGDDDDDGARRGPRRRRPDPGGRGLRKLEVA